MQPLRWMPASSISSFQRLLLITIAIVAGAANQAFAATLYVDATVEESGDGSQAEPLKTIAEAVDHPDLENGDTIRIRGGNDVWPFFYFEEGMVLDTPWVTVTNWETDSQRPWILGTFTEDDAVAAPAPNFDIFSITASGVTVSNLVLIDAWYCGVAVRNQYGTILPYAQMVSDITIENCLTYHTGSSGLMLMNARDVIVRDNTVIQAVYRFGQECITLWNVWSFDVDGNEVRDRPQLPGRRGGEGIDCKDGTRNGTIRNNRLLDVERHAIYIDGFVEGCQNIEVLNNFVRNCGPGLSVASERGGLVWNINMHGNVVTDCAAGLFLGPQQEGWDHPVWFTRVAFNTFVGNETGINIANPDTFLLNMNNNLIVDNISPFTGNTVSIRIAPTVVESQIGLGVWNNVFKSGTDFDFGNRTVDDDTNQLHVQQFAKDDPRWDDPEYFYATDDSPALDNGWYTFIGDPVLDGGIWRRLDISGYERFSPGYLPPFGQDIGARERY